MKKEITETIGFIYKITSPLGDVYIGQTICTKKRKYQYKKGAFTKQTKLWNNCQKYNWNPSETFEVIDECLCGEDKKDINDREIYWISFFDSLKNGLNCTEGGKGQVGRIWTEEQRIKQSNLIIGMYERDEIPIIIRSGHTLSEEHKIKISNSNKSTYDSGREPWNKGRETPQEVKDKISKSTTGDKNHFFGKTHSEESIAKITEANIGRIHTEETKQKMSKSSKCKYYPHTYGVSVLQYDMNNNLIKVFKSIKEASMETGCSSPRIVDVCKGNRKHTKNFIWRYDTTVE